MPVLCCLNKKVRNSTFRDRLPEHIKKLTVDVTHNKTETRKHPECVQSPKDRRYDYRDSD